MWNRRQILESAAGAALLPLAACSSLPVAASRVRPGDPGWPSSLEWDRLRQQVGGRLASPGSPWTACGADADGAGCADLWRRLKNPFFIGDDPALTQSCGWVDAWTSAPSARVVAAENTADVVAAVDFARRHRLRLVVKGGGHSYQGTSNAPDSLLVWTRAMNRVDVHDAFTARGCAGSQPAVSIGAGAMWLQAYDAVTTQAGRYVQGGGCTTVGVAGLVQSGGFGSFSKGFGTAAAGLIEAEVVTADGQVLIANACSHPELFWGLKGGGGGNLGIVTRLTLRTRPLPAFFGAVIGDVRATSDAAYRALMARLLSFYRDRLMNPHWGEQVTWTHSRHLRLSMLMQGLTQAEADREWQPFIDWVKARPADYVIDQPIQVIALPARRMWDPAFLAQVPGVIKPDDRSGVPAGRFFWSSGENEAGQMLHAYRSAWLPAGLLGEARQAALVDALFESTRHWQVTLHLNKGLAGATPEDIAAARDTAMNPDVLDAFALAILGAEGPPAHPGVPGHAPDLDEARSQRRHVDQAMAALLKAAPGAGSYVSESNYFEADWQRSFWGANYSRLAAVKRRYDPDGLFFTHHGPGSEAWSADGFTRIA